MFGISVPPRQGAVISWQVVPADLNQLPQHSQLRAMGVEELKMKKPRQMPRL